ncbi:hypothetical protein GJ496_010704 [Pomphorhynchus laevis]|nr:hypothetical protein GJ496_010704 [Pomphorhynchus laevis]
MRISHTIKQNVERNRRGYFNGKIYHPRTKCPTGDVVCHNSGTTWSLLNSIQFFETQQCIRIRCTMLDLYSEKFKKNQNITLEARCSQNGGDDYGNSDLDKHIEQTDKDFLDYASTGTLCHDYVPFQHLQSIQAISVKNDHMMKRKPINQSSNSMTIYVIWNLHKSTGNGVTEENLNT